jgi:hypothetical protein
MIYPCKSLDQFDLPAEGLDNGKLKTHALWVMENIDAINASFTRSVDGADGIEYSWVWIALKYLEEVGAIVVDHEPQD